MGKSKQRLRKRNGRVVLLFRAYSSSAGLAVRRLQLRSCGWSTTLEGIGYPIPGTVASRRGRTKASFPTVGLGFAVAGWAKAPIPTLALPRAPHLVGLVLASRRLAAGMGCGRFGLLDVGGNLSTCGFEHVVFFAVMVDLQSAQKVHQVPCVVGLNGVGE